MKKWYFFLIVLLVGCSEEEVKPESEPVEVVAAEELVEPYEKAIEAINEENWQLAHTYLERTMEDFPQTDAAFAANLLLGYWAMSGYYAHVGLIEKLASGAAHQSTLISAEEIALLRKYSRDMDSEVSDLLARIEQANTYFHAHVEKKSYAALFHDVDISSMKRAYYDDLSFFADIGVIVPKQIEVDEYILGHAREHLIGALYQLTDVQEKDEPQYELLDYLLHSAKVLYQVDETKAKANVTLLLGITAQDPYNEQRIEAERIVETHFSDSPNGADALVDEEMKSALGKISAHFIEDLSRGIANQDPSFIEEYAAPLSEANETMRSWYEQYVALGTTFEVLELNESHSEQIDETHYLFKQSYAVQESSDTGTPLVTYTISLLFTTGEDGSLMVEEMEYALELAGYEE